MAEEYDRGTNQRLFCIQGQKTDLDNYVHSEDIYFKWEVIDTYVYPGSTIYMVNMTAQKWQDGIDHFLFFFIKLYLSGIFVRNADNNCYNDFIQSDHKHSMMNAFLDSVLRPFWFFIQMNSTNVISYVDS